MAIENVIYDFAKNQFAQGGLSIEESMLIMKSMYLKFSEQYINQSIMKRVKFIGPESEKTNELKPARTETVPLTNIRKLTHDEEKGSDDIEKVKE